MFQALPRIHSWSFVFVCVHACMRACVHACMDAWMHRCIDAGWMDGRDGRTEGWMDVRTFMFDCLFLACICSCIFFSCLCKGAQVDT